jgi:hypothetical protein
MGLGCNSDKNPFPQINDCGAETTTYTVGSHYTIAGKKDPPQEE